MTRSKVLSKKNFLQSSAFFKSKSSLPTAVTTWSFEKCLIRVDAMYPDLPVIKIFSF